MTAPRRKTARYFPSQSNTTPGFRAFLFTRDLPLGIMPYRSAREDSTFAITLEPHTEEVATWLVDFVAIGQFHHRDLESAITEFVETATTYIGYTGEAYFELGSSDADTPSAERPTRLCPLPPGRVRRLPGRYLQVVPTADRAEHGGSRYISVPAKDIWHLRLPASLGTPRQHRRMLNRLAHLSELMPEFAMQSPDLGRRQYYDFSAHRKASEITLERTTNRWGTIPSLFHVEGTSEYYFFARRLAWQRSQALLRDHIVAELNALLRRLGIASQVVVAGLPSAQDIERTLAKLKAGEIDVAEVVDAAKPKAAPVPQGP